MEVMTNAADSTLANVRSELLLIAESPFGHAVTAVEATRDRVLSSGPDTAPGVSPAVSGTYAGLASTSITGGLKRPEKN
jgi:hypothetical protein